jgi:hypothetical protein
MQIIRSCQTQLYLAHRLIYSILFTQTPELIVLIDKGAFNGEQRGLISSFLEGELGVRWTVKAQDVKKMWEQSSSKG